MLQVSQASKQYPTPQPRNDRSKFDSILITFDSNIIPALPPINNNLNAIARMVDNLSLTFDDKLVRTLALHARW